MAVSAIVAVFVCRSQDSVTLKGTITNGDHPIVSATVSILDVKDSAVFQSMLSSTDGNFSFTLGKSRHYLLSVTAVGFGKYYSAPILMDQSHTLAPVVLKPEPKTIEAVTVQAKRPFIESKLDKMVVNVDASPISAGSTVLELLEKTPGVTVDRDGNISLKGKQGVLVYIDGRQTYLSAQELADLLRSMPASQLDQVEIITQPSSKYDASGNAGVLNLKTKKLNQVGLNGSLAASVLRGNYTRTGNSFTINSRHKRFNFFANLGYAYRKLDGHQEFYRVFARPNDTYNFDQKSFNVNASNVYNGRIGLDYYIDSKTTIGATVGDNYTHRNQEVITNGSFAPSIAPGIDSSVLGTSASKFDINNLTANINFRKQLKKAGQEFSIDADLISYRYRLDQFTNNKTAYPNTADKRYLLRAILPTSINVYSIKADYAYPLDANRKIEFGAKSSIVNTDNDAPYEKFNENTQQWEDDIRRDHFAYREWVSALYLNYAGKISKWSYQLGFRGENTNSVGKQILLGKKINRNYIQFFPTAFLSYEANKKNYFRFSYGRRLERPNYRDLNPFQRFLDLYTYDQGNPFLTPQFTHNIEAAHSYNNKLTTVLSYSRTTDIINEVIQQDEVTKVILQTKANVATRSNIGLSLNYSSEILKGWNVNVFTNGYRSSFKGFVNGALLDKTVNTFAANMSSTVQFAKTWTAEASGFYQTRMLFTSMFVIDPAYAVSFGISKQLIKGKATVKLNINDAFDIQRSNVHVNHDKVNMLVKNRWDNRWMGLTFTYRFKNGQSIQQRKNSNGAGEEQNRIGG